MGDKVKLSNIPLISYELFYRELIALLQDSSYRIVSYYGFKEKKQYRFVCVVSKVQTSTLFLCSYNVLIEHNILLAAVSQFHPEVACFELAISMNANAEDMSITFVDLPVHDRYLKQVINPVLVNPPKLHPVIPMTFMIYTED